MAWYMAGVFLLAGSGYAVAAPDCGQAVAAPRWEVGDTWTVQNESGEEFTERVVAVEGGLSWMWRIRPDGRRIVKAYDADLVLRKVVRDGGKVIIDRPGEAEWVLLGIKTLDFPLHVGKSWSLRYDRNRRTYWSTYRVVGCEELTVVGRRFWTLKLEVASQQAGGRWQGTHHEWYAPAAKRVVRTVFQRPNFGEDVRDWEVLRVGFSPLPAGAARPLPPERCGFPVSAPRFSIGESWTYQDESGAERTDTVVAIEGDLTRIESVGLDTKTVVFYDADISLHRLIRPDGSDLKRPQATPWGVLNIKSVDYPLEMGKRWSFAYESDGADRAALQRTLQVVGCEEVSLVAGKFPAVKLEVTSGRPDGWWHGVFHLWYAPQVKRTVRVVYQRPNFRESLRDRELLRYRVR
jgi:hypothetical protein